MINRYAECYECEQKIVATCPDTHSGALEADALIVLEGWDFVGNSDGVWICPECRYFDEHYIDYGEWVPGGLYA